MDSSTCLDYVLFQLTPTRTRCDLVIFAGKLNEKLAYGLLEPFIAHLRSAKDQISKGGYSVTLRPPPSSAIAPWFTKATLQRFVRFVSTPEVLERFVTIEREIAQLENSIKSYEASNADGGLETDTEGVGGNAVGANSINSPASFKSKSESNKSNDPSHEENAKVRLQRVVETRKAVLQKEQAMVYARALAAGFQMENLDDLLLFSDAFGASRLREACINFKELCKKKNEDRFWVDEIAAMQAIVQPELSYLGASGIILAGEDNDPKQNGSTDVSLSDSITSHGSSDANQDNQTVATDSKAQVPNPWANQFPPYLRNFQGPVYQQMPPYQGYVFPGMQVAPPYYPPNMQWPPNFNGSGDRESHDRHNHKSSSKKKDKASDVRSENEEHTDPSGSSNETETDSSPERSHRKKHGKKSSRKVVIRNINYITSKRDGEKNGASELDSSDEDDYLDGDLKQQVEEAVGSVEKHQKSTSRHHRKRHGSKYLSSTDQDDDNVSQKNKNGNKGNENWDAFQHLLMRDESDSNDSKPHPVQVEEEYFTTKKPEEQNSYAFKLEAEERAKQRPVTSDAFLVTEKGTGNDDSVAKISVENFDPSESYRPAMKRGSTDEEFLFSQRIEEPETYTRVKLSDDSSRSSVIKSQISDDWFVSKQSNEETAHLGFIDGDYVTSSSDQVGKKKNDVIIDDSIMIHGRITDDHTESHLRTNISLVSDFVEASLVENGMTEVPLKKSESLGFYEPIDLYMVRDRDTSVVQTVQSWTPEMDYENNVSVNNPVKSQPDGDVCNEPNLASNGKGANNKKSGATVTKASSKDPRPKALGGPLRKGKPDPPPVKRGSTFGSKTAPKSQLLKEEERRKRMEELLVQRQKRIAERSTSNGSEKSKPQSLAKDTNKPKAVLRSSTIERLAAAKTSPKAPMAQTKKELSKSKGANLKTGSQKTTGGDTKKLSMNKIKSSEKKVGDEISNGVSSSISVVQDSKFNENINELDDSKDIKELHITSSVSNKDVKVVVQKDTSDLDHSLESDSMKDKNDENGKFPGDKISPPELSIHPVPESPIKQLGSTLIVEEKSTSNGNIPHFPEISEIEESTPPLTNGMSPDSTQLRKKWDSGENSPKSTKGFRKLLMFGRKS